MKGRAQVPNKRLCLNDGGKRTRRELIPNTKNLYWSAIKQKGKSSQGNGRTSRNSIYLIWWDQLLRKSYWHIWFTDFHQDSPQLSHFAKYFRRVLPSETLLSLQFLLPPDLVSQPLSAILASCNKNITSFLPFFPLRTVQGKGCFLTEPLTAQF